MRVLKHLSQLPMIYINPDQYVERRERLLKHTAPLFKSTERASSFTKDSFTDSDAQAWIDGWWEWYTRDLEAGLCPKSLVPMKKVTGRTKAVMACREGWMDALARGVAHGYERFMVCEDDAMPRAEVRDPRTLAPPTNSGLAVWQGAITFGSFSSENATYLSGRRIQWQPLKPITQSHLKLCAGAIEFSHEGAKVLLEEMRNRPGHSDHSLGYAYRRVPSFRSFPNLFAQYGPNIRSGTPRDNALSRKVSK